MIFAVGKPAIMICTETAIHQHGEQSSQKNSALLVLFQPGRGNTASSTELD
jgi:hypothetical protein